MRLREVEVRNWRGLDRRTLDGLHDGVNLVLGPNEAGKSRLYEGIRFGLFEGHKGQAQHKADLQSWTGGETPFVRIALELDGVAYEIQKQFLKGGFAQLAGKGVTLKGEEAEEQLRQLLGTQAGNNRGPGLDELGIWPMLMVEQGASRSPVHAHMNGDGRATLHKRLSSTIGEAAVGAAGQRLLDLVEREFQRYFTTTGQPGAAIRDARKQLAEATAALEEARSALARQAQCADELSAARAHQEGLAPRLLALESEAKAAALRAQQAARLQGDVQRLEAEHKLAFATLTAATKEAANRTQREREVQEAEQALGQQRARQKAVVDSGALLASEANAAAERAKSARETVEAARRTHRLALDAQRREALVRQKQTLESQIQRMSGYDTESKALTATLASLPKVTAAALKSLRAAAEAVSTAKASLQGAAVSLSIVLKQGGTIDGQAHPAGAAVDFEIVDNRTIDLGEFGSLSVRPGAGEIAQLRDALNDATANLASELQALGVESLEQAVAAQEQRQIAEERQRQVLELKKSVSDKTAAALEADLQAVDADLAQLGDESAPAQSAPAQSEPDARFAVADAEEALAAANDARDQARAAAADHQQEVGRLDIQVDAHETLLGAAVQALEQGPSVESLQKSVAAASLAERAALGLAEKARAEYAAAGGDEASAATEQAERAVEAMRQRARDARSRVDQLGGELRAILAAAPFESVQDAEAALELATAQAERIERESAAVMLLRTTIREERRKVVEKLVSPVIEKIRPYIADLFPGSSLEVGEDLQLLGLNTRNVQESFAFLSGGAQEQLSLLARIGLAEVLADDGPLPLILDDVLINTDPERILRAQRALFRAAKNKLQVILFSCHDRLFDSFGADRLIELKATRGV